MSTDIYLSTADVAKVIRADLKREFPGQKFSVRSQTYAGGSSVHVEWTDGPRASEVEGIVSDYAGRGFDGSIDMAYHYYHVRLPDGRIVRCGTAGTAGSLGYVEAWHEEYPGAVPVTCSVSYIFCNRHNSREAQQAALDLMVADGYITADAYVWHEEQARRGYTVPAYWEWKDYSDREWKDRAYSERLISMYRKPDQPPAPATAAPGAPAGAMTVTQDRDWVWIEFATKPADDLIAALKGLGARWSKRRQAWYLMDAARLGEVMALA